MIRKSKPTAGIPEQALILCLIILLLTGCSGRHGASETTDLKSKAVKVITTSTELYTDFLDYKGFVLAKEQKTAAFVQPGTVKAIFVDEGQHVRAGETLAVLDTNSIDDAIEAMELNQIKTQDSYTAALTALNLTHQQIQEKFDRIEILFAGEAVSQQDYDDIAYALENIENEIIATENAFANDLDQIAVSLEQCNRQLADSVLTSPIDGIVIGVIAQVNQISGAGTPAFILVSDKQVVNIGVSIEDISKITMNMDVQVVTGGSSLPGKVSKIAQYPDQSSRTYTVEVTPDAKSLTPGAIADVKIPLDSMDIVMIPISAVISNEGVNFVYLVEKNENGEDMIVRKEVILGEINGANVEAVNIKPGTIIVADDVKNVKENDIVIVIDKEM